MKSLSENTHYLDVFFFKNGQVIDHKINYYQEDEVFKMFQRVINKYKGTGEQLFMTIRTIDHELIKCEKNFK